jgi:hypothetical protein
MQLLGVLFGLLLVVITWSIFLALPLMLLWNWLMPDVFGLQEISFLQALAMNLLSGILLKSSPSSSSSSD